MALKSLYRVCEIKKKWTLFSVASVLEVKIIHIKIVQRASEASEADYQSCSIEISDIYIYIYICDSLWEKGALHLNQKN